MLTINSAGRQIFPRPIRYGAVSTQPIPSMTLMELFYFAIIAIKHKKSHLKLSKRSNLKETHSYT